MKQVSQDSWLALGLFATLLVITFIAAAGTSGDETAPPLASDSSQPNGSRALRLWLIELGYQVSDETVSLFQPPQNTNLIFILEPRLPVTPAEWQTLDDWVEAGGTLVLAGDRFNASGLFRHYDFTLRFDNGASETLTPQTPLWSSPPLTAAANSRPRTYLQTDRSDFITYLASPVGPVLVSFVQGAGQVILSTLPFSFSNEGLKEIGNPQLILNILAMAEQRTPTLAIWFDEWHHGLQAAQVEIIGPGNWLRYTPAGRSLLYVALVIFVALALQGRRFGRPVSLPKDTSRRAPLEYITAIANLKRRAGHRQAVLQRYHQRLKRDLGQRYRLNPTLPDDEYVSHLAELKPDLDAAALRTLLARLRQPNINESEMVTIAAEVATWLKET